MAFIDKNIRDYDAEAKQWDMRRKEHTQREDQRYNSESTRYGVTKRAHESAERRRVEAEFAQKRADAKEKLKAEYDYKPRPHERQQILADVEKSFEDAVARAKIGGKDPAAIDDKTRKAAEEESKEAFNRSVFADPKVDPQRFRSLAADIMTSNPSPDANTAMRIVTEITRIDPNDATARIYKVRGRDPLNNVILEVPKLGAVHVRQNAYEELTGIIRDRLKGAAERDRKAAEDAAIKAAPSKTTLAREATTDALEKTMKREAIPVTPKEIIGKVRDSTRSLFGGKKKED
jgi:hypothetical protein